MKTEDLKNINTSALAYMGDAVYEQAVREHILKRGSYNVNNLHHMAIKYVCAHAQAKAVKTMLSELDDKEQALVRRARNRKFNTKAKNADPMTYKWATAFEAYIGYLYLAEDAQRLEWAIDRAISITDDRDR